jgi:glycosyltransferase involved in cell wall biosynthesis
VQRASGVVLPSKYSLERFNFHFPSFPEDSILVHSPPRNEVRPLEQNEYAKILCELGINRPFFFHLPGNEHDPSIPVSIQAFQSSQAPIAGMQFVLPQEVSQANRIPGLLCLPKLSPNQIHALHSAAEAVIAPKQGAHNPSQLIEALQCGACGVAMDSGAYPETLQGAWPLGDSKDSHSFARILDRQLIDPHFRREICAASLRRSSEILREDSGERLYDFLNGFLE